MQNRRIMVLGYLQWRWDWVLGTGYWICTGELVGIPAAVQWRMLVKEDIENIELIITEETNFTKPVCDQ